MNEMQADSMWFEDCALSPHWGSPCKFPPVSYNSAPSWRAPRNQALRPNTHVVNRSPPKKERNRSPPKKERPPKPWKHREPTNTSCTAVPKENKPFFVQARKGVAFEITLDSELQARPSRPDPKAEAFAVSFTDERSKPPAKKSGPEASEELSIEERAVVMNRPPPGRTNPFAGGPGNRTGPGTFFDEQPVGGNCRNANPFDEQPVGCNSNPFPTTDSNSNGNGLGGGGGFIGGSRNAFEDIPIGGTATSRHQTQSSNNNNSNGYNDFNSQPAQPPAVRRASTFSVTNTGTNRATAVRQTASRDPFGRTVNETPEQMKARYEQEIDDMKSCHQEEIARLKEDLRRAQMRSRGTTGSGFSSYRDRDGLNSNSTDSYHLNEQLSQERSRADLAVQKAQHLEGQIKDLEMARSDQQNRARQMEQLLTESENIQMKCKALEAEKEKMAQRLTQKENELRGVTEEQTNVRRELAKSHQMALQDVRKEADIVLGDKVEEERKTCEKWKKLAEERSTRIEGLMCDLNRSHDEVQKQKGTVHSLQGELSTAKRVQQELEERAKIAHLSLDADREKHREIESVVSRKHQDALSQHLAKIAELEGRLRGEQETTKGTDVKNEKLQERLDNILEELLGKRMECEGLSEQLNANKREIAELRQEMTEVDEELRRTRKRCAEAECQAKKLFAQKQSLAESHDNLKLSLAAAEQKLADWELELSLLRKSNKQAEELPTNRPHRKSSRSVDGEGFDRCRSASPKPAAKKTRYEGEAPAAEAVPIPATKTFVVSGFKDKRPWADNIASIDSSARFANSAANDPVSYEVTHLVTGGGMTVKLFSALLRGCWVLPLRYLEDSKAAGRWLDEKEYGFRHEKSPFAGKIIAYTEAFGASRHFHTMSVLEASAGCTLCQYSREQLSGYDIVLCHSSEFGTVPKGQTFDTICSTINPQPVA